MKNNFLIYPHPTQVAEAIAEELLRLSLNCVATETALHISLSGGSTPALLFKTLAQEKYLFHVQWKYLHFWWGDERLVPREDSQSNYGEAWRTLFHFPEIPQANIHPVNTSLSKKDTLSLYEQEMQSQIPIVNGFPQFDWIILGMGTDGHTASLFPNHLSQHLAETQWTEIVNHPESNQARVSLTTPLLKNAKRLSYLVTGEAKAPLLVEIQKESQKAQLWPAFYMCDIQQSREWFLDQSAAQLLDKDL